MTNQWKDAIRQKRKHAQIYARNRSPENWKLKRKWRNIATRETRRAIKNYWSQKSDELKTRPRDFFKTFNPFLRSKGEESKNISLRADKSILTDQQIVAEVMGDYFSTMANDIGGQHVLKLDEHDFNNHQSVEAIRHYYSDSHFQFKEIKYGLVENELRMINTSNAPGWDAISPNILNLTTGAIAAALTRLGVWTPVFKKDDRANKTNYRPITVLNSVAKVFESLLSKQISDNIDSQMYSKMSAYRKMHSCEANLIRVTEDWKKAVDNKECVAVLSTDMSKALALYIMLS